MFPGIFAFIFSLAVAFFIFLFGFLLARTFIRGFSFNEQILVAYPAFFIYVYILVLVNILFKGALFSNKFVLISIFISMFLAMILFNRSKFRFNNLFTKSKYVWLLFLFLVIIIYSLPILRSPRGVVAYYGDMMGYIGLATQIILGKPIPLHDYQNIPNYYPWMFPNLLAYIQSFFSVTGFEEILSIYMAYNVLGIVTIVLAFLATRALSAFIFKEDSRKVALATFLGTFSGGLGFLAYDGSTIPTASEGFLGDMLINYSYNGSLSLVIPAWPRHLSYAIHISLLYFLSKFFFCRTDKLSVTRTIIPGMILGLIGIIQSIPFIITGIVLGLVFLTSLMKLKIEFDLIFLVVVAGLVISPWALPLLLNSLKYGTASTTSIIYRNDLPPQNIIIAVGQVMLFAPLGLYYVIKNRKDNNGFHRWNVVNMFSIVYASIIIISNLHSLFNLKIAFLGDDFFWQQKYWFNFYPIIALYATEGAHKIIETIQNLYISVRFRSRAIFHKKMNPLSIFFIVLIVILGSGSPILTSLLTSQSVSSSSLNRQLRALDSDWIILKVNEDLRTTDVVAVPVEQRNLQLFISCYTGAFIAYVVNPRTTFVKLNETLISQKERVHDLNLLYDNETLNDKKYDIIRKYGITHIVSLHKIENMPNDLIKEIHTTSFFTQNYYLYVLKREWILKTYD